MNMPKNQNNRDVTTWLTNFTKSIAYSAKGMAANTLFPETSQHISSSMDLLKEAKDKFKESAVGVTIQTKRIDSTSAGRMTMKILKGMMEDVRSGDFSIPKKDEMFDDFGVDMDFDITETENDDGSSSFDIDVSNDAKLTATAIVDGSILTTEAIANMSRRMSKQNAKSTEAMVRTIQTMATISTNAITKQMIESNERLEQINDNIATIVNFLKESQATVNEATMKHYSAMEEAMAMQLKIWGKNQKDKERSHSRKLQEDGFDPNTFAKMVKKNFKNNSLVSTLSTMGSMGSMLTSFSDMGMGDVIRPMDMALQFLIGLAVPKNTKAAIQNLDKNIPKQLNRMLSKLGDHKGEGSWTGVLADLFGYDSAKYSKMSLSSYNKNAISWDGYSKKALEEVIPFYLSDIAASLNPNHIKYIYDYKSGTFKEKSALVSDYNDEIVGSIQSAFQPLMNKLDEMMKTSDGQYKSGWSEKSQKSARRDFGKIISEYLKSQGTMTQDQLEKAFTDMLNGDKYAYKLSDFQRRELREEARSGVMKFASQTGDSDFIKKYSNSSDYAGLRSLINSGDLSFVQGEDGLLDLFGSYLSDDVLNRKSSFYQRYEKNKKEKKERDDRNKVLIEGATKKYKDVIKNSKFGNLQKHMKLFMSGGGKTDEKLSSKINQITKGIDSAVSMDIDNVKNTLSDSGIKGLVGKIKDDMKKYENGKDSIHKSVVIKALISAGIDPDCYHFKWEQYANQEWLYRGDLEVIDANNKKWDQFPRVILPNMFINGKFDIEKAKENFHNSDMCESTDIAKRKRLARERAEAKAKEREAYENSIKEQSAAFIDNPRNESTTNNMATVETPTLSDVPKIIGTENTSSVGANHNVSSGKKRYRLIRKKSVSSSSESVSDDSQRYNSAKSAATNQATIQGSVNGTNINENPQNVGDAINEVADKIKENGAVMADTLLGDNNASQDAIEESMQEGASKLSKADISFGDKVKGKLKTALKVLIAGLVGKKIFSRKGLNVLAAATSIGGPIGVAMVGLGATILASKIDFRRMFFGYENTDKNGEIKKKKKSASLIERIFNSFKSNVIDEFALGARGFIEEMGAFAKAQLAAPLKRLFSPLMEGMKSIGIDIKDGVKKKLGAMGSHIKGAVSKAATIGMYGTRIALRGMFFGARSSTKGALKVLGAGVKRAMYSRMAKDYKAVYKERWKEERDRGYQIAEEAVSTIYKNAGKNPTPEAIQASKEAYFETNLADSPNNPNLENRLNRQNIEFLLEQMKNNENYKNVRQKGINQRYRMNVYHRAMWKGGNSLKNLTDDQLKDTLTKLQKGSLLSRANFKDDKTLQRLIDEGNREDMIKYLETSGTSPDYMAKIFDQRDRAKDDAIKREKEEEEIRTSDKKYKNKILYFLSFMANRLSHGKVPVMDPENEPSTIGSTLSHAEVDPKEASEEIANANQATLEREKEQRDEAAEKQAAIISENEKSSRENAEDAATQSFGSQKTRKGGYERNPKKNDIYSKEEKTEDQKSNEKESGGFLSTIAGLASSLFGNKDDGLIGNIMSLFGGGGGGGLLGTLKSGLTGIFRLLKNPATMLTIGLGADLLLNEGKGTKATLNAVNSAINPFAKGSQQHETKIEAGNGTSAKDASAYVINEDGTISIKKAGNPALNTFTGVLARGMANATGNTIGEQVVSTINNSVGEYATGAKAVARGAGRVSKAVGTVGEVVLNPIKSIKQKFGNGGWDKAFNINTTPNNIKKPGIIGNAINKVKTKAGTFVEGGIDKMSAKLQTFASNIGTKMGKITGRVAENAEGAVVDTALKQSDDLVKKAAGASASPEVTKAATGSLRSIWNKIKGMVDDVLKTFEQSAGAKSFLSAIGLDKGIDKIISGVKKQFHKIADGVNDKILAKFKTKLTSVGTKMVAETASDAAAFIPVVGQVLKGLEAVWNGISGAMEAANLFSVKEEDVDIYMRAISAAMKVFFNFFPFVWIIPLIDEIIISFTGGKLSIQRLFAEAFYDVTLSVLEFFGNEKAGEMKKKLDESQAEFDKEFEEYNKRTGNNLSKEEYNDMKNKSLGDRIGGWWNDDVHFWDNEKTKIAKNMKKAYYEYGANSDEYKKLAAQYEEKSGKSAEEYLGISKSEDNEAESAGEGPAGYGIISSIKSLFNTTKSEAKSEIKKSESAITSGKPMVYGSKVSLLSSIKQLGVNISKQMLSVSPEWNAVAQLTQIRSLIEGVHSTLVSLFRYTTKMDEVRMGNEDSNSGEGFKSVGYGFNQADPRWANMSTGKFKNGQKATMKTAGCGFSALADVDRMFGGNSTPDKVARTAMSRGDVADGGAKASLFEKGINGVHGTPIGDAKSMESSLRRGQPVIISGQAGYGSGVKVFPKSNKHLVVGRGMDSNGNVIVENPMYGTQKVPFSQLASQTKGAWAMSKSNRSAGYGALSMNGEHVITSNSSGPGDKNGKDYIFYQQQDPQWAGMSIGPGLKVGPVGCVNTAAAMASTLLNGKKIDPGMMAQNVFNPTSSSGGFTATTWTKLKEVYGVESTEYGRRGNGDANTAIQKATEALKEGKPVSLHGNPGVNPSFSWNNKTVDTSVYGNQHDILAYGIDKDGNFLIADPSDSTGAAGTRGKVTAAHIAPGSLINGLHWARIYSKDGKGVSKNANFSAVANMEGNSDSGSTISGNEDGTSLSDSASGAESGDTGITDIFSTIGEGLKNIASSAINSFISGGEYKRVIDSDGSILGTAGDDSEGNGIGATVNGRFNPMGYGMGASDDMSDILENRLDQVLDLLSQIADNTKQSSGHGFIDNSSVGYGSTGNSKTQLRDSSKKRIEKDLSKRVKEKEETPKGDLGRSNLMAIHKVIASGYRGATK